MNLYFRPHIWETQSILEKCLTIETGSSIALNNSILND